MTEARAISDGRYVLIKRGLYWKPNSQGYTALLSEAGIYSDEESRGYAGGAHDGMTYRVPASEAEDIAPGANDESKARYWKGRAAAMAEELMALREAVKPFADAIERYHAHYDEQTCTQPREPDGETVEYMGWLGEYFPLVTLGDFRRAAKAVNGGPNV